jgi:uncharacterized protein
MKPELPKLATSLAILTALFGPPLVVLLSNWLFGRNPTLAIEVILEVLFWGFPAFVVWVIVRYERLPLASIGLRRPDWSTLIAGVLVWIGLHFLLPLITQPLVSAFGTSGFDAGLNAVARRPVWFRVIGGLTAGIVEETLYRGYALERLGAITGRRWFGGAISAVIFGVAHIPFWGVGFALAVDLPFGIVMTVFYLWKRDLVSNMIAHSVGIVAMLPVVP